MIRHLIPRAQWGGWSGDGLTVDPAGGVELPPGFSRMMRQAQGLPTTTRKYDAVVGGILTIQWLGIIVEIAIGKVR